MNRITKGFSAANSPSKERILNFSVAAASLWTMRHLLFGMVYYFMICQIPGIMVKADLFKCVCMSLLFSMIIMLVTLSLAFLGSLSYVTYRLFKNTEEFLTEENTLNLDWMADRRYLLPSLICGVVFNAVLLKAFASFYPNLIMIEGWAPALIAAAIIVCANRSLTSLQKNVIKLSLADEIKAVRGRA